MLHKLQVVLRIHPSLLLVLYHLESQGILVLARHNDQSYQRTLQLIRLGLVQYQVVQSILVVQSYHTLTEDSFSGQSSLLRLKS